MPWSKSKERINKNRQKFLEYKKTLQCKNCGLDDHRVLEFHHIGDKDYNVSNMVSQGFSWDRVKSEISKCIPLCCNCHRLEHWESKEERPIKSQVQGVGGRTLFVLLHQH